MMTYSFRNKTVALAMAVIFALSLIMVPLSTAFAAGSKVDIDGDGGGTSYRYIKPGDKREAGTVKVTYTDAPMDDIKEIYFKIELPNGVEFSDVPDSNNGVSLSTGTVNFVNAGPDWLEVVVDRAYWDGGDYLTVDFSAHELVLDIDDDFRGDIDVDVRVEGRDIGGSVFETLGVATVSIAKVIKDDVKITAGDPKKLSAGTEKKAAKITIEELKPKALPDDSYITFEILTDGVKFSSENVLDDKLETNGISAKVNNVSLTGKTATVKVTSVSTAIPGEIIFTPMLEIHPDMKGNIKIEVNASGKSKTFIVAKVGAERVVIDEVENNDGIVYVGKYYDGNEDDTLDTTFKIKATGHAFRKNDIITFELSDRGEFLSAPGVSDGDDADVYLYSSHYGDVSYKDKFHIVIKKDNVTELEISDIAVWIRPDAEPGDLKLKVGGDYGDLGEITIAKLEKPFTVEVKGVTEIVQEENAQPVADIIIKEVVGGAIEDAKGVKEVVGGAIEDAKYVEHPKYKDLYLVLPEGVAFAKAPEVVVTEGNLDIGDVEVMGANYDVLWIRVDRESYAKSTIEIRDIQYAVKNWKSFGDVEVRIAQRDQGAYPFTTVVNAKVIDDKLRVIEFNAETDDAVEIKNGRVMLRVNALCDELGLDKHWDAVNRIAYFYKHGVTVAFPIGEDEIMVNGVRIPVDQGAEIINDFTYVPIRYIETGFGGKLDWDDATKTATYTFTK